VVANRNLRYWSMRCGCGATGCGAGVFHCGLANCGLTNKPQCVPLRFGQQTSVRSISVFTSLYIRCGCGCIGLRSTGTWRRVRVRCTYVCTYTVWVRVQCSYGVGADALRWSAPGCGAVRTRSIYSVDEDEVHRVAVCVRVRWTYGAAMGAGAMNMQCGCGCDAYAVWVRCTRL
jgi:hypothetical protein